MRFIKLGSALVYLVGLIVFMFAGTFVIAQDGTPTRPLPDLSSLSWIAGTWTGVQGEVEMEEHWLPAKGNMMLGLHRDVVGPKTVMFEYLRIEATPDAITYWASPKGRPATPFRLKESGENRVVFENPEHDFPQQIIYWLDKDGALHAKIEGTQNGKVVAEEWTWRKK